MIRIARSILLAGAGGLLAGIAPVPPEGWRSETLAMLDPARQAASLCGGGARRGEVFRARMQLAAAALETSDLAGPEPLYEGLGPVRFPVTTDDPIARRYFDQGVALTYGFNHAAAIRAFKAAQALDPKCALCFWGEAFAYGPNINAPMDAASVAPALAAVRGAQKLASAASPLERALIEAIAVRYSADAEADRAPLDAAFADAMLAAAARFPDQDDLLTFAAEAAMDTSPWNYWTPEKTAKGRTADAIRLVETVLARNPGHPGAAHLYIHLMENGPDPKRAEAAADRLAAPTIPAAGHLVHMPAHIYMVLGRHADSIRLNVAAARADEEYLRRSGDKGLYRFGYYPHNVHFIVASAQLAGDARTAVREAQRLAAILDPGVAAQYAWIQPVHAAPYFAHAQVASPDEILALPEPDARLPFVAGMRHYARAVARARQRDWDGFDSELEALRKIKSTAEFRVMTAQGVPAPELLQLAEHVALGRRAYAMARWDEAAGHYREAAAIEAKLPYTEPAYWYYPVRQSLGAALLRAGRAEEARTAFMGALSQSPNNAWALYGLAAAERALGRRAEAAAAEAALKKAWLGDPRWLRLDRL